MTSRDQLATAGLRATQARMDVLDTLSEARAPLDNGELAERLGDMDRVTLYRNLLRLTEVGLIRDLGGRYELGGPSHPHFVCRDCGDMSCLPPLQIAVASERWRPAVAEASIQLRGTCPDCRA